MNSKVQILLLSSLILMSLAARIPPKHRGLDSAVTCPVPRNTNPSGVSATDISNAIISNSMFAVDLYKQIANDSANTFFSPYSITIALAMTFAGARSSTCKQIHDTLHFKAKRTRMAPILNAVDLQLDSLVGDNNFNLSTVNSIWGQKDFTFRQTYLNILSANYGVCLNVVDFVTAPTAAQTQINNWVSNETNGKITNLIPDGFITAATRLILVNAIYFKANWTSQFDVSKTNNSTFNKLDGTQTTVKMMNNGGSYPYFKGSNYQAIQLKYKGNNMVATFIVPDAGAFDAVKSSLSADALATILKSLQSKSVGLGLPKFKFTTEFSLKDVLQALGMTIPFSNSANFSGMDGKQDLFISDVIHKSFVAVDEEGTEAAAATAVGINEKSAPIYDVQLTIDRPFMVVIHTNSNLVLFMGHVVAPVEDDA